MRQKWISQRVGPELARGLARTIGETLWASSKLGPYHRGGGYILLGPRASRPQFVPSIARSCGRDARGPGEIEGGAACPQAAIVTVHVSSGLRSSRATSEPHECLPSIRSPEFDVGPRASWGLYFDPTPPPYPAQRGPTLFAALFFFTGVGFEFALAAGILYCVAFICAASSEFICASRSL